MQQRETNKQTYNFHEICQVELVLPVHESKLSWSCYWSRELLQNLIFKCLVWINFQTMPRIENTVSRVNVQNVWDGLSLTYTFIQQGHLLNSTPERRGRGDIKSR